MEMELYLRGREMVKCQNGEIAEFCHFRFRFVRCERFESETPTQLAIMDAARARGPLMKELLTKSIPISVSFNTIKTLPMDEWTDVSWFDAMNPRAVLPFSRALVLAVSFQGQTPNKVYRAKIELLNRMDGSVSDDDRDAESCRMLDRLMRSGYVWLPALAAVLEDLPVPKLMALCIRLFGGHFDESTVLTPAGEKYRVVELGIIRENIMRRVAKLNLMMIAILDPTKLDAANPYDLDAERKAIETLLVELSVHSLSLPETSTLDTERILRQGFLAHLIPKISSQDTRHTKELQTIMRRHLVPTSPGWLRCFIKS